MSPAAVALEEDGSVATTSGEVTYDHLLLDGDFAKSFENSTLQKECGGHESITTATARSTARSSRASTTSSAGGNNNNSRHHVHVGGVNDDTLQLCYEALDMIDPSKKKEWEQAKVRCPPRVLEHECCPCYFLRVSQSNPWAAAQHLCRYWDERVRLFEGRAFDAMTSGYDGREPTALTQSDVEILETGYLQLLPNDSQGRSVLGYNFTALLSYMQRDVSGRLRVRWYMHHKAFTSGAPQAHLLVSLVQMHWFYYPPTDVEYASACMNLHTQIPFQTDDIHLMALPASTGSGRMAQAALSTAVGLIGGFFEHLVRFHNGDSTAASAPKSGTRKASKPTTVDPRRRLLQQLRKYGFGKKDLPEYAGGSFTQDSFQAWLQRQRRIENQVFSSEEQQVQRLRDRNRVNSHRKRERRQEELRDLQNTVQDLQQTNARAKEVQADLLTRLHQANSLVVTLLESNQTVLPQQSVHASSHLQALFASDDPTQVGPRGRTSPHYVLETQMTDWVMGCTEESSSDFLKGGADLDPIPLVALAPVLPRNDVAFPNATSWQLTYPDTFVPADFTIMNNPSKPPLHCFPPNDSVLSLPLPPEEPAPTIDPVPASTLPLPLQALIEGVPDRVNTPNTPHGSPTCVLPSSSMHHGWNDASVDQLLLASTDRCRPPVAPAAPLIVCGLERVVFDSSQSHQPRRGRSDDDSAAETLFDGVLDSWGCLI